MIRRFFNDLCSGIKAFQSVFYVCAKVISIMFNEDWNKKESLKHLNWKIEFHKVCTGDIHYKKYTFF